MNRSSAGTVTELFLLLLPFFFFMFTSFKYEWKTNGIEYRYGTPNHYYGYERYHTRFFFSDTDFIVITRSFYYLLYIIIISWFSHSVHGIICYTIITLKRFRAMWTFSFVNIFDCRFFNKIKNNERNTHQTIDRVRRGRKPTESRFLSIVI